jgi:hypothetical protein
VQADVAEIMMEAAFEIRTARSIDDIARRAEHTMDEWWDPRRSWH